MEKITLPIKTKIAAWWMILLGGILLVVFLLGLISFLRGDFSGGISGVFYAAFLIWILMISGPGMLLFLPGLFLLQRRKWAWKFALIILPIGMIIWLVFGVGWAFVLTTPPVPRELVPFVIIDIITLGPLILVFLDRKNFWKIAS